MTKTYKVEIVHEGETHTIEVPEDKKILEVANDEYNLDLPNSCNAGVCTTCAGQIISPEKEKDKSVDQSEGMGVSPELQKDGYVLMCVAHPRSDLKIETGKEDEVYDRQFGQSNTK